jgi:hypothetical protein
MFDRVKLKCGGSLKKKLKLIRLQQKLSIQIQVQEIAGVCQIEVVAVTRWTSYKRQEYVVGVVKLGILEEPIVHPAVSQVLHVIKNVASIDRQVVGNQKFVIGRQRHCLHELQPETNL